jgi:CheY-like chemotaxis protein
MTDKRGRFAPTIMLVDDDKLVTKRWRREFHNSTSLGVVVANSLADATAIIEADEVQIDAVVSDLIFDHGTDDPTKHLHDGVDFLSWLAKRPAQADLPLFVMSATENMVNFSSRLEEKSVKVEKYFDKFLSASGAEPAWDRIQRSILERKIEGDFIAEPRGAAPEVELIGHAMAKLQLSVRTYIQELPGFDVNVLKPIEAICIAQEGGIKAYAPSLGLLGGVRAESVQEVIEELSMAIGAEAEFFLTLDPDQDLSEYAQRVAERFREYLQLQRLGERAGDGQY